MTTKKKYTLTASTPDGVFTRTTARAYTHIVVRESEVWRAIYESGLPQRSVMNKRLVRDFGRFVTWHGSLESAQRAAGAKWDLPVTGIFAVDNTQSDNEYAEQTK